MITGVIFQLHVVNLNSLVLELHTMLEVLATVIDDVVESRVHAVSSSVIFHC